MLRVIHFSTDDICGGAAKAAYRIHRSFLSIGNQSYLYVKNKQSIDDSVHEIYQSKILKLINIILKVKRKISPYSSNYMFNYNNGLKINNKFYDIIPPNIDALYLHWITNTLSIGDISNIACLLNKPIVWNLMDMEPFTGGCHYSFDCDNYVKECSCCHLFNRDIGLSHTNWIKKYNSLSPLPITFISPTTWLTKRIKKSSLFSGHRIYEIPLPIDKGIYYPENKYLIRDMLGLPTDKKIIFFGAYQLSDKRKGMNYLFDALNILSENKTYMLDISKNDIFLIYAGNSKLDISSYLPFNYKSYNYQYNENELAKLYKASDVFLCPSIEDAGPMMIAESMMCGTPVVSFSTGMAPDIITSNDAGYLAKYKDSSDFAFGIYSILKNSDNKHIRESTFKIANQRHDPNIIINKHVNMLYEINEENIS
jgi:glycosyltransferase involved in cell wall biosynthesis